MSETESKKTMIIAIVLIGIVGGGLGIYGIGKYVQNLTALEDDEEEEPQIFFEFNKTMMITDINNDTYDLSMERNKFVILYFYTLQCSPCVNFHAPNLKTATDAYSDDELLVIAISMSSLDKDYNVKVYAANNNYTWMLCVEGYGNAYSGPWNIGATPTTIYIGENNIMRTVVGGQYPEDITANIESVKNYSANSTASASAASSGKISCKSDL